MFPGRTDYFSEWTAPSAGCPVIKQSEENAELARPAHFHPLLAGTGTPLLLLSSNMGIQLFWPSKMG